MSSKKKPPKPMTVKQLMDMLWHRPRNAVVYFNDPVSELTVPITHVELLEDDQPVMVLLESEEAMEAWRKQK